MSENTDLKNTPAIPTRPPPKEAFEKLEQKLPPGFKPKAAGAEVRALETLLHDLNRPGMKNALPPSQSPGEYSAPLAPSGQTITADDPALEGNATTGAPSPATAHPEVSLPPQGGEPHQPGIAIELPPPAAPSAPAGFRPVNTANFRRVFLTGRSGAGTTHVARQVKGALVYDVRDVSTAYVHCLVLGKLPPQSLYDLSKEHPGLIIVTGIDSMDDYKLLVELGFEHYHVCCSSQVLPQRPNRRTGHDENMALNFDQQTAQTVRQTGPNKKIVWNDPTSPLPPRLMSVQQFVLEMQARAQA